MGRGYFWYSTLAARIAAWLTFLIGLRQEREMITEPADVKTAEGLENRTTELLCPSGGHSKTLARVPEDRRYNCAPSTQRVFRFDSFAIRVSSVI